MGLFRRGRSNNTDPTPAVASPTPSPKPVGPADLSVIGALSGELKKSGAIGKPESEKSIAAPEADFQDLFREAAAAAKYEDELNPDFHRPEVEAIVSAREAEQEHDWENPSLDGLDDYGTQVYDSSLGSEARARLLADEEEDALDFLIRRSETM